MLPNVKDKTLTTYDIYHLEEAFKHALIGVLDNEANRTSDIKAIFNLCDENTKHQLIEANQYLAIDMAFKKNSYDLHFTKLIPIYEPYRHDEFNDHYRKRIYLFSKKSQFYYKVLCDKPVKENQPDKYKKVMLEEKEYVRIKEIERQFYAMQNLSKQDFPHLAEFFAKQGLDVENSNQLIKLFFEESSKSQKPKIIKKYIQQLSSIIKYSKSFIGVFEYIFRAANESERCFMLEVAISNAKCDRPNFNNIDKILKCVRNILNENERAKIAIIIESIDNPDLRSKVSYCLRNEQVSNSIDEQKEFCLKLEKGHRINSVVERPNLAVPKERVTTKCSIL